MKYTIYFSIDTEPMGRHKRYDNVEKYTLSYDPVSKLTTLDIDKITLCIGEEHAKALYLEVIEKE